NTRPGGSNILTNKRPPEEYRPTEDRQKALPAAIDLTRTAGQFDVIVNAKGGGLTGQAEATQLGIARALVQYSEDLRKPLRDAGYLTRDPRMVERKKYGQPKARKRFQFSKR